MQLAQTSNLVDSFCLFADQTNRILLPWPEKKTVLKRRFAVSVKLLHSSLLVSFYAENQHNLFLPPVSFINFLLLWSYCLLATRHMTTINFLGTFFTIVNVDRPYLLFQLLHFQPFIHCSVLKRYTCLIQQSKTKHHIRVSAILRANILSNKQPSYFVIENRAL